MSVWELLFETTKLLLSLFFFSSNQKSYNDSIVGDFDDSILGVFDDNDDGLGEDSVVEFLFSVALSL